MSINKVSIKGYVYELPKFMVTERGPRMEIILDIDRTEQIGKRELLTIITEKKDIIARLLKDELKPGDFFVGNCVAHTWNYEKDQRFVCPHCHESVVSRKKAEIMNVDIISYDVFYDQAEFSRQGENKIIIEGRLYDDPKIREINRPGQATRRYAKFKMKCRRTEDNTTQEYDFPFVVGFGKNAEKIENLRAGDKVLVVGAIQERQYMKEFPDMFCPSCNYEVPVRINSYTREIIAEEVSFLKRWVDEEKYQKLKNQSVGNNESEFAGNKPFAKTKL